MPHILLSMKYAAVASLLFFAGACGSVQGESLPTCPGSSDTTDSDGDGTPDPCDLCAGTDDSKDADNDGVPDGCDVCKAGDDKVDADADTVADACDVCAAKDDKADADKDAVPDGCDMCAAGADSLDTDADGMANACDPCPTDKPNDANNDRVCDSVPSFDIGYISEMTFAPSTFSISSLARLANTGTLPVPLQGATIVSFSDDNATINFTANISSNNGMVQPGRSAGSLSPLATTRMVNSGVVSEPEDTANQFNISFACNNVPAADQNMKYTIVLQVAGRLVNINGIIHFRVGLAQTTFDSAVRFSSQRSF